MFRDNYSVRNSVGGIDEHAENKVTKGFVSATR